MAGIGPLSQDWEPVVIRKKVPNAAARKDEKAVNAARRMGAEVESVKNVNNPTPFIFYFFFFSLSPFVSSARKYLSLISANSQVTVVNLKLLTVG